MYKKIIVNERGGFCFETNALYQWLLKAIGYQVTSYHTRLIGLPPEEQLKRHRMIRVDFADASYITDVGIRIALSRKALRLEKIRFKLMVIQILDICQGKIRAGICNISGKIMIGKMFFFSPRSRV